MAWCDGFKASWVLIVVILAWAISPGAAVADFSFGEPVNIGPKVNSPTGEVSPCVSYDGLELYFGSYREGGLGDTDIWLTRRPTQDSEWEQPVNAGLPVNTVFREQFPMISPDGSTLYFMSTRPGGFGGTDLWQAPILPICDFNGDGKVDGKDILVMREHWGQAYPLCDIGPMPWGDGIVDSQDLNVLLQHLVNPVPNALDVPRDVILSWVSVGPQDVYLGTSFEDVNRADRDHPLGVLVSQGQTATTYDPKGLLDFGRTYYWRIDEVNEVDSNSPWKGNVWSFTTGDFMLVTVVDDFESYTDDVHGGHLIWDTWVWGGGGWVGNLFGPPYAEQWIVHGGRQSMPMEYYNDTDPWYSEAERTWETPQDWTMDGADALTLHFRGQVDNSRERLYVAIEDNARRIAVVAHPDPNAVLATKWQKWQIPLADLRAAGVDPAAVVKMVIGVGDRNNPQPGGTGKIYIDDIRITRVDAP